MQFSRAYHPYIDDQIEVVNRSMGNLLRILVGDKPKKWDEDLAQEKFIYNSLVNRLIGLSLFQIMYGRMPKIIVDLVDISSGE